MYIDHLVAENFRNIPYGILSFTKETNLLYGKNASGKTNALEAIYLFAACKSFRTNNERDFIRQNYKTCQINIGYVSERNSDVTKHMMIRYFDKNRKHLKYEDVDVAKVSEFLGNFRAILFTPDHLSLIKGMPDERRKFADLSLCQIRPRYVYCLNNYLKILSQKNSFLKTAQNEGSCDMTLLEVLNTELAAAAGVIVKQRYGFIEFLRDSAAQFYRSLSGENENLNIKYISSIKENLDDAEYITKKYADIYSQNYKNELKAGMTLYGPHRDDILFFIEQNEKITTHKELFDQSPETSFKLTEYAAKTFGSQGQQRSAVLALKLAEGELYNSLAGEYPVFLFDDVLGELDGDRRKVLLKNLENKQIIITCCEDELFSNLNITNKIRVSGGEYFTENKS